MSNMNRIVFPPSGFGAGVSNDLAPLQALRAPPIGSSSTV
jgi:hypothetical protein